MARPRSSAPADQHQQRQQQRRLRRTLAADSSELLVKPWPARSSALCCGQRRGKRSAPSARRTGLERRSWSVADVMNRLGVFIVLLNLGYEVSASSAKGIDRLLELGTDFLSKGRFQDALQYFHEAVEADPDNYLAHYKRGTVYLALGKSKQALDDFDRVVATKKDLTSVRIQRGNIHLKNGDLDKADSDFRYVLMDDAYNPAATQGLQSVNTATEFIDLAESTYERGDYEYAISILKEAIEICPWSAHLRKLRAKCYIQLGDPASAVSDIRSTTKLTSDNTDGYFELSSLLYQLGHVEGALDEIRNCLKLDPEHKDCFPLYRKIKKIAKLIKDAEDAMESNNMQDCISKANSVLKQESSVENVRFTALRLLCKAYTSEGDSDAAIKQCSAALKIQKDVDTLCDSAEAYLAADMFDDAIQDYREALKIDSGNQRAKQGLQKAEQRQKQSETRDYYKILGVKRNAQKKEIVKAYRKAAQQWHPDNFPDPEEKKRAEKKFIDIAAAKEVLTDEQKRAEFDAGRDPLDPESGKHQQHGFNPFQEFHHFQGSPFQFKFHFN